MSEMDSELFKKYNDSPDLNRLIIEAMVVRFVGINRYQSYSVLESQVGRLVSSNQIRLAINSLIREGLLISTFDLYDVPLELKLELFPGLICQEKHAKWVSGVQEENRFQYYAPITQFIRDYLFAGFVEENQYTQIATDKLISSIRDALPFLQQMLRMPIYDKALMHSSRLFYLLIDLIHLNNILFFTDFRTTTQFFIRNSESDVFNYRSPVQLSEMLFQTGKFSEPKEMPDKAFSREWLLLKSQIELFQGKFDESVKSFEMARIIGRLSPKAAKTEFNLYYEFFYWLNFVFYSDGLDLKRLEAVIKKCEKSRISEDSYLVPLLYYVKRDQAKAEEKMQWIYATTSFSNLDFHAIIYLFLHYIIFGRIDGVFLPQVKALCAKLLEGKRFLFLREVAFIMEKSGFEPDQSVTDKISLPNAPLCLMSQLISQEKWEVMLDGLLNLTRGKSETEKKEMAGSRVCYLLDMEDGWIQPILRTLNAKGLWSAGKNISLKRLKEQQVEGLTEQDRRLATVITHTTSYYSSSTYDLDFDRALPELCGHPYLFLFSNPKVSIEVIKTQPEIVTENVKNGIRLKTNITKSDKKVVVIKETQTRYKLITLNPQQQTIIRMIKEGVTIPLKGKEKLLEAVSHLSGLMTVHSDMAGETAAARSVGGDSRIRIQIVPVGDGLRAEMFVKPFGSEPPYVKPGKGGKVVYGLVNGEKYQAIRDLSAENSNSEKLNDAVSIALDADLIEDAATFTDPYECLELLEILGRFPDIAVVEWPEGERFRLKKSASWLNLNLRIKSRGQWFELDGELNVDEVTVLNLKELIGLTKKSKGRFIELKAGEFLALTDDLKKHLDELEALVSIDKNGISVNRFAAHALDEITARAASFKSDKLWKEFQNRIHGKSWTEAAIPATLDGELRPYQEEGFRWMTRLKNWEAGACLADDMGLGKTVQAIAMMLHLAETGPILVVCPASVVGNWGNELRKFAPTLNPMNLKPGNREDTFASLAAFDVLVITYGLLQTERERIAGTTWAMAVLDEAHAIKNTQTKSSKSAMTIQAGFKLALTGTPIQNHLGELWNLFNFCNPGLLGTLPQFTDRYVKNDLTAERNHLKRLITPFILRRTKNKVLDELPPKTEITYAVQLSDKEMAFYEALRQEAVKIIENNDGPQGQQHLQALVEITKLRLACCNSSLVNKDILLPSAKLEAFFEILEELRASGHRALVFSQFVGHLSIVRKELDQKGISYQYLDGSTSLPNRELAVKAFQSGKGELFLISLKAGGLGLNLTAADYVLHLDPWWNPAVEDQASDRAHRIGQSRPVTIYRLVARNTIEEKILKLHATKRDLADSLLEGTDQSARLSTADLLNLLREG